MDEGRGEFDGGRGGGVVNSRCYSGRRQRDWWRCRHGGKLRRSGDDTRFERQEWHRCRWCWCRSFHPFGNRFADEHGVRKGKVIGRRGRDNYDGRRGRLWLRHWDRRSNWLRRLRNGNFFRGCLGKRRWDRGFSRSSGGRDGESRRLGRWQRFFGERSWRGENWRGRSEWFLDLGRGRRFDSGRMLVRWSRKLLGRNANFRLTFGTAKSLARPALGDNQRVPRRAFDPQRHGLLKNKLSGWHAHCTEWA